MKILLIYSPTEQLYYTDENFNHVVNQCIQTDGFLENINRIADHKVTLPKTHLEKMIDSAVGYNDKQHRLFFIEVLKTVYHTVYIPLLNTFENSQKHKGL